MLFKNIKRFLVLLIPSFFVLLPKYVIAQDFKSVLYINSYGVTYSWGDSVASGIIESFKARPDILLYVEYLDTKRFGSVNNDEYFQLFKKKYSGKQFNVAIASDNAALEFLMQYGNELAPDIPVAFCGINNPDDYNLENTRFYGIKEGVDLDSVIHLVLRVMPGVKNLYFINDSTETSITNLNYAKKLEPEYKYTLTFKYITNISVDSLYSISGKFIENSAIVLLNIFQDINKKPVNSDVVMQKIASISNIPIFMDSETSFGKGIVGGIINNGRKHGQAVAELALNFIDNPDYIPPSRVQLPKDYYYFDYNVVKKYKIKSDLIPVDAIVINKPENLKRYLKYFAVFIGIIAFLLITNSLSIININKRKKAEKQLEEYKNQLEVLVEERTKELFNTTQELQVSLENLSNQKEELNQTIEELKSTREQLIQSEKLASLGVFTAGIAHEINNPVNYISSGLYAMFQVLHSFREQLNDCKPDMMQSLDEMETIKQAIEKGIEKISAIVSSLRNYSHAGDNGFVTYDLVICIKDALVLLHSTYKNRIKILGDYPSRLEIECNPGKLNQLFTNIINNAIQSISGEGSIAIKVRELPNEIVEIQIKDTGCGIDDKIINKIFDPFFTTKQTGEGTGLGLYIVHGIVNLHRGSVTVESEMKKGTTFIITLPKSQK